METWVRQPVVVVLGHVDSGKTSLLDKIRGTAVQAREVAGMTQHIGASFFPMETLRQICGSLLARLGAEVRVPGLLVIDTPGHEVFANLRSRGGSAADLAVLVVDILRGFEVQTHESVEILRARRVPFVVALNKLDLLPGWHPGKSQFLTQSLPLQDKPVTSGLDGRIYTVVGTLSRLVFNSEAFYRIKDFTREIAIVPVSAKTGEGIPELLSMLIGLTQQYLQRRLSVSDESTRGIVLEVKEETGLGHTANVILLDGTLHTGDAVVVAKREGAVVSRVKAIFMPKPLDEMRDPRDRFLLVEEVRAAAGVKIVTPDLEGALAGSPLVTVRPAESEVEARRRVESEVRSVFVSTDRLGVVVKADTLGTLEAIMDMLRQRSVPVRLGDIGPVTRRDIVEAAAVRDKDRYLGAVLTFGVRMLPDAEVEAADTGVRIFRDPIVYTLVEEYLNWVTTEKEALERGEYSALTPPCKLRLLPGYVFRRSDPAIFGVEVLGGRLRQKVRLINEEGREVGLVHQIQDKGRPVTEAAEKAQVAVSVQDAVIGRTFSEGDVLYALPSEAEARLFVDKFKQRMTPAEAAALEETITIRRKVTPLYAF
jgi:translation initiation factor 5B